MIYIKNFVQTFCHIPYVFDFQFYFSAPIRPATRRPNNRYSNVRARISVRNNRPIVKGFANVGAVFGDDKDDELHPQVY